MSAWRQPLFWLVLALPGLTVVAAVILVVQAGATPASSPDAVRRVAQIQTTDDRPDRTALALGLSATWRRHDAEVRVLLPENVRAGQWVLHGVHATDSGLDATQALHPCAHDASWLCADWTAPDQRFHLRLVNGAGSLRLVGTIESGQVDSVLRSALAGP